MCEDEGVNIFVAIEGKYTELINTLGNFFFPFSSPSPPPPQVLPSIVDLGFEYSPSGLWALYAKLF